MSKPELFRCPRYPGYSVTKDGRVFSHRTRRGIPGQRGGSVLVIDPEYHKEKAQSPNQKGYMRVNLVIEGKNRPVGVHELVLDAFHGPRPEGMVGRHLDGDQTNNTPDNLAWGTHFDNAQDRQAHGRYSFGGAHHNAKLSDEQVAQIKRLRADGMKVKDLAARYGVGISTVEDIIYRRSRAHINSV